MAWFNSSWTYRKLVTINSSQITGNLTDFTAYLDLSLLGSDFFTNVKTDGSDIIMTTSDGTTQVAVHVVDIDTIGQTGRVNFKAPSVSSGTDTDFYIYYGNSGAVLPAPSGTYGQYNVYSSEKILYYGMDSGSGSTVEDYTSNNNDGSILGATWTSGIVGKNSLSFDGNDRVTTGDLVMDGDSTFTVEFIFKIDSIGALEMILSGEGGGSERYPDIFVDGNGAINFGANNTDGRAKSANSLISANTNYHVIGIANGTSLNLIVNGSSVATFTTTNPADFSNNGLRLGQRGDGTLFFMGDIDELRVYNSNISTDLANANYNSLLNTASFYTIGTQEQDTIILNIDTQTLSFTSQDINLSINRNLSLDTQSLNFTPQDITLKINRKLIIDTATLSFSPQNINVSTGETISIDSQTLSFTPQDINLVVNRNLSLDNQSLNFTPQDINLKITRRLNIDTTTLSFTPQDINLKVLGNKLQLDTQTLNFIPQDIKFRINFSQSKLQNLNQARKDVIQIINETGENLFYRKYTRTLDSVGQFSNLSYTDYLIKGVFISGDNKVKSSNEFGEYVSGIQRLNVAYILETAKGEIIQPQVRDCVISLNKQIQWEITEINELRMFGDVIDNYLTLQRKDLIE